MFKFGLGYIGKLPRFFMLLSMFITCWLLVFLFLSCLDGGDAFAGAYIVQYTYNQDTHFFDQVAKLSSSTNTTQFTDLVVRSGFLSVCASTGGSSFECAPRHDLTKLGKFAALKLVTGTSSNNTEGVVDPLAIAQTFSINAVNPYFICLTLFFTLVSMVATTWTGSAKLPRQDVMNKVLSLSTVLAWFSWAVGAIWLEVAANTAVEVIPEASASILDVHKGSRASGMSWTSFTFLLITLLLSFWIQFKQRTAAVIDSKV